MKFINRIPEYLNTLFVAVALVPLIVIIFLPFPYNFSKVLYVRILVEIGTILSVLYLAYAVSNNPERIKEGFLKVSREPIAIAVSLFFVSMMVSTFFARNTFSAFWGDVGRGDGLFGLLHYFVLFLMAAFVISREAWIRFFKLSIAVGYVMNIIGWFQYWNIDLLPFTLTHARPGSLFENPAYMSSYLLWLVAFALIVLVSEKKKIWRFFAVILIPVSVYTLFLTNVRGGILGFFVGALVLFSLGLRTASPQYKKYGRIALVGFLALGALFVLTRNAPLWQNISGLGRLATIGSGKDSSMQTRLIALGVSWEAFKEEPMLGWGPENFMIAYNKYYNPAYAVYEEAWFDRPHNKIAEIAVTQGAVGLIAYLGIILAFFLVLYTGLTRFSFLKMPSFSKDCTKDRRFTTPAAILAGATAAYVVQNLFLFDTPSTFVFFYGLLGYAVRERVMERDFESPASRGSEKVRVLPWGIAFGVVAAVFYLFYAYTYIPLVQSRAYRLAADTGNGARLVENAPQFLEPYNYIQPTLRIFLLQSVQSEILSDPKSESFFDLAIRSIEEVIRREPEYDPRHYILAAELLNEKAGQVQTPPEESLELFKKSEVLLRKALELSPLRQDVYYILAYALAGQERFDEAVALSREAVALDPRVAKAHYFLGLELTLAGKEYWDEAELEIGKALDIGFLNSSVLRGDFGNISSLYQGMLSIYIPARDKERVVRIAKRLKQADPELASDMDIVIDLAERGEWDKLLRAVTAP